MVRILCVKPLCQPPPGGARRLGKREKKRGGAWMGSRVRGGAVAASQGAELWNAFRSGALPGQMRVELVGQLEV